MDRNFLAPRSFAHFFYLKSAAERMNEMSVHKDIFKDPLRLDHEFLMGTPNAGAHEYAIPRRFWRQALEKRYDQMYDYLVKRQEQRMPHYEQHFKEVYPQILQQMQANGLKGIAAEKRATDVAGKQAEEYAERAVPHIDYPEGEETVYELKPPGARPKPRRFVVRPRIREMVSSIEHDPGVEGFDLWWPRTLSDGTKVTRGFTFPNEATLKEALGQWLNHTAHRMLGELPGYDDPNHTWQQDQDEKIGQSRVGDTFTIEKRHDREMKKWFRMLMQDDVDAGAKWLEMFPPSEQHRHERKPKTTEQIRANASARRTLASALAWNDVKSAAVRGEIVTPPSKAHETGQKVQPVEGSRDPKTGRWKFYNTELHLPHRNVTVYEYDPDTGAKTPVTRSVPLLLPGRYLRPVEDHERDKIPEEHLLGYEKDYVDAALFPLHPNAKPGAQGSNHLRSGAVMPTHNTTGRKYLPPGWEKTDNSGRVLDSYDMRLRQLEGAMAKGEVDEDLNFTENPDGPYFSDIVDGIRQGLSEGVGGAGGFEVRVLRSLFSNLHRMGYLKLAENLRDPEVLNPDEMGRRTRINKIKVMIAKYAQQDWGRGTRRLRGTGTLRGVAASNLNDYIEKVREHAKQEQAEKAKSLGCDVVPRGQGGRIRPAGRCEWQYDVTVIHEEMLRTAKENALIAQKEEQQAMASDSSDDMASAIQAEQNAAILAFHALTMHYINFGADQENAERQAQADVLRFKKESKSGDEFIDKVRHYITTTSKAAERAGSPDPAAPPVDPAASLDNWKKFVSYVGEAKDDADFASRFGALKAAAEAEVVKNPALVPEYQKLLDRYERLRKPIPGSPVPPAAPAKPSLSGDEELVRLFDQKQWAKIAFTPRFQKWARPTQVRGILKLLESKAAAGTADAVDRAAILLLKSLPQMKVVT